MPDDEKFKALRNVISVLAVLYFYVARYDILLCFLDWLLSMLSFLVLYVLSIVIFSITLHTLAGMAFDSDWLQISARIVSAFYMWAGMRLVRTYGSKDTSALKTVWLSWLMTPLLAERLIVRREKMRLADQMPIL